MISVRFLIWFFCDFSSKRRLLIDHIEEFQRFFNRFFFIRWALRLLYTLRLRLIVAFPLNDFAFLLDLRDIQR